MNPAEPKNGKSRVLDCAVIGAGVSGLAVALELCDNTAVGAITLYDKLPRTGGVVSNISQGGYLLENAAQGVLASRESFLSSLKRLELADRAICGSAKLKRYLILDNRIIAVGGNLFKWVTSGLLTLGGLLRFLLEPFAKPLLTNHDETMFDFFSRRFGKQFATRFVVPMATGIWGGGAKKILVRFVFPSLIEWELRYGSLCKAAFTKGLGSLFKKRRRRSVAGSRSQQLKGLVSFPNGLDEWTAALKKELVRTADRKGIKIVFKTGHRVTKVSHQRKQNELFKDMFRVGTTSNNLMQEQEHHALFSSVPLWRESLEFELGEFCSTRFECLRQVDAHGIVVVGLGGKDSIPPVQGFGALAPEESKNLLGVIFVHSTYPQHAPRGHFLFRLMLGGDRAPAIFEKSDNEILELAKDELKKLSLCTNEAQFAFEHVTRWPGVIPLQDKKQESRLQAMKEIEAAAPGFYFVGNYVAGVGIHDCLVTAKKAAGDFASTCAVMLHALGLLLMLYCTFLSPSSGLAVGVSLSPAPPASTSPAPDSPRAAIERISRLTELGAAQILEESIQYSEALAAGKNEKSRLERKHIAERFLEAFDKGADVRPRTLSDKADGDMADFADQKLELVGTIKLGTERVPLVLAKVQMGDGSAIWKVSQKTVSEVLVLLDTAKQPFFLSIVPEDLRKTEWAGILVWQWFAFCVVILLSLGAGYLLSQIYRFFVLRVLPAQNRELRHAFKGVALPLASVTGSYMFLAGLPYLDFSYEARQSITTFVQIIQIVSIGIVIYRIGQSLTVVYESHLRRQDRLSQLALIPPLRKALIALIFVATVLILFQTLGFNVSALIAGLGVGGLAVALAGQKTFENLFGGISIVLDQPIRVGDLGRYGSVEGTVEDIGLRSTRVRTPERTIVTIPNAEFSQIQIENFAKRDRIRYRTILGLRYDTNSAQLRAILTKIRNLLKADKRIDSEVRRARLLNLGSNGLEIEVLCYVKTKDYDEYLSVREELNFAFLEIIEDCGSELAFQTQTVYQGNLHPLSESKRKLAEEFVAGAESER